MSDLIERKRQMIMELLIQCTEPQKLLFNRMYGNVFIIEPEKMDRAHDQCYNTVAMNKKKNKKKKS